MVFFKRTFIWFPCLLFIIFGVHGWADMQKDGNILYYGKMVGDTWQSYNASEKQALLWGNVTADTNSSSFSNEKLAELFLESMQPSFDAYQDDLLGLEGPLGFLTRYKFVHTVGAVGEFTYKSIGNHPYTGIFKGVQYGILRLSTPTAFNSGSTQSMTPAAAFKFLRDGVPSGNVLGIGTLEGSRDTFNFFKHDLYSNPTAPSINLTLAGKVLEAKFKEATKWVMIGLRYMATYDERGNLESNPKFPYNLVFQGSKSVKSLFGDQFITDNLPELLSKIPPNIDLYNVYAEEPNQNPLLIGKITLTSRLTGSSYGDEVLFFQHQRKEFDFELRPDWIPYATQIVQQQSSLPYYNGPADLPDI